MHQRYHGQSALRRGFTLLELLIVIATILILAAILFPIFRSAIDSANRSACVSNLHQIAQFVEAYRQDYAAYPPPSGMIGLRGIPQEGITALALSASSLAAKDFWCSLDPYEARFPRTIAPAPQEDFTSSTYSLGYNYYGLVAGTDGLPIAVTSEEAARYLFDDGNPNWSLDLIDKKTDAQGNVAYRPRILFQGLWNTHAPPDTIVTYCLNHPNGNPKNIPAITVGGAAVIIKPVAPQDDQGSYLSASGPANRRPGNGQNHPPIDWRLNTAPYTNNNKYDNSSYGDSAGNESATLIPVVESYYRLFDVGKDMSPVAADGAAWYDTGLDCKDGDVIMVRAVAKWNYYSADKNTDRNHWAALANGKDYEPLFDDSGALYFNAAGNPVEVKHSAYPATMVLPNQPHCLLIGKVGDAGAIFPLGSCGSLLVKAGAAGTLKLSFNDTATDYSDNNGWCEVWFGIYRPNP